MSPRWEPNPDIRRGRTVVHTLHAHLVFTPKYRRRVFDDAMLTRCEEIMRKVCEDFGAELREFNGETDHVHLLVHYPPKVALSRLVGSLKGVSARLLRQEFTGRINRAIMHGHFWSPSYFAASCGGAPLSIIKEYIEQQKRPDLGDAAMRRRSAPPR
ncbi:MAG: IS200/IS605 family transposase [Streptomycetaceae bacterium]|nr:IS200/IS605 family transposase [Streptomycetaceae bacterium]